MNGAQHSRIINFIWGIADDVLRDVFVRGKYRDVILPMTVLRRFDAVLEPSKQAVLKMAAELDKIGVTNQEATLRGASGQAFYNTSPFTLKDLRSRETQQKLRADFEAYLDGFSPNVREILDNFEFRNQIPKLTRNDALGALIEKFLARDINLSPDPVLDEEGRVVLAGLDNHSMGTIFEELVRRFNEDNNEEAGEHWTPRDAVKLMTRLMFLPIAEQIDDGTYLLYDGACGTGGMLTVAEETLQQLSASHGKQVTTHLYGQEINAETYAICKADMLLKGDGEAADNVKGGPEYSTLSNDAFPHLRFDFMLANPPYGKSWKGDQERMGGKKDLSDPRFVIEYAGDPAYSLITSSSDGQMLFLVNMASKMKHDTTLGSRIAEVHNGSSLFTGDAGSGESNIRRWIIENDWLEAVVALPLNMFYNTGIATYVWVLTNRKPAARHGKVQLIDGSGWSTPLRKNLGKKNCELSEADIDRVTDAFLRFEETEHSRILPNEAFGYWKITVDRPLRLASRFSAAGVELMRFASGDEAFRTRLYEDFGDGLFEGFSRYQQRVRDRLDEWAKADSDDNVHSQMTDRGRKKILDGATWARDHHLAVTAAALWDRFGDQEFLDYNEFEQQVAAAMPELGLELSAADRKALLRGTSWRDERAAPVILKRHKSGVEPRPLFGLYEATVAGKKVVVEYESDSELRDTEQVPLLEEGGIERFFEREVLAFASDAWVKESATRIGYEINFSRHFYQPKRLRTLEEIRADILAIERETEGLLGELFETDES